jgi:two-component system cell cycle response regulator DivK
MTRLKSSRSAGVKASPGTPAPLILVVDDYSQNREMYAEFLRFSGFRVLEASNGHEALEQAFGSLPDLIVMDLSIPGIDGWEATRKIKNHAKTKDVPVIAVTGVTVAEGMTKAKRVGCDLILTKPCTPDHLEREIRRMLGRSKRHAAAKSPRRGR